uniref:Secreted protein n=1 Tax=Rhipicephalus zambeziensis TaxID=60191 RepID=A0A224YFT2_9ACAR
MIWWLIIWWSLALSGMNLTCLSRTCRRGTCLFSVNRIWNLRRKDSAARQKRHKWLNGKGALASFIFLNARQGIAILTQVLFCKERVTAVLSYVWFTCLSAACIVCPCLLLHS